MIDVVASSDQHAHRVAPNVRALGTRHGDQTATRFTRRVMSKAPLQCTTPRSRALRVSSAEHCEHRHQPEPRLDRDMVARRGRRRPDRRRDADGRRRPWARCPVRGRDRCTRSCRRRWCVRSPRARRTTPKGTAEGTATRRAHRRPANRPEQSERHVCPCVAGTRLARHQTVLDDPAAPVGQAASSCAAVHTRLAWAIWRRD